MLPNETKTDVMVDVYMYNLDSAYSMPAPKIYAQLPWHRTVSYLNSLKRGNANKNSHIRGFRADVFWKRHLRFLHDPSRNSNFVVDWSHTPELHIKINACDYHYCKNNNKCFENIINGKCTDPFVVKYVGKKFFADKYKDKTR